MIKLSIIISILNSHEILRRQLIHFKNMDLPGTVEFIFLDDGSDPPLTNHNNLKNLTIHQTNDTRDWTVGLARNMGARLAQGEYLLMTDIDYIITRDAIESAMDFTEDKMSFKREFGVLTGNGAFTKDFNTLRKYGLLESRIRRKGNKLPPHPNNFVMKRDTFWMLGGYPEDRMNLPYPKCTGDGWFKRHWTRYYNQGKVTLCDYRPTLYIFPSGQFCGDVDYNPFGLFHNLTRKTDQNYWYQKHEGLLN